MEVLAVEDCVMPCVLLHLGLYINICIRSNVDAGLGGVL